MSAVTMVRPAPPEERNADLVAANLLAADEAMADMDGLAEFMCTECADECCVQTPYMPRDPGALQAVLDKAGVPMLLALMFYPRSDVSHAAAWEMRERYLKSKGLA